MRQIGTGEPPILEGQFEILEEEPQTTPPPAADPAPAADPTPAPAPAPTPVEEEEEGWRAWVTEGISNLGWGLALVIGGVWLTKAFMPWSLTIVLSIALIAWVVWTWWRTEDFPLITLLVGVAIIAGLTFWLTRPDPASTTPKAGATASTEGGAIAASTTGTVASQPAASQSIVAAWPTAKPDTISKVATKDQPFIFEFPEGFRWDMVDPDKSTFIGEEYYRGKVKVVKLWPNPRLPEVNLTVVVRPCKSAEDCAG